MSNDSKLCPFCGSDKVRTFGDDYKGPQTSCECGASAPFEKWNNRPLEILLKKAIDELLEGVKYVVDNQYTHNMNARKLKQVRVSAIAILTGKKK